MSFFFQQPWLLIPVILGFPFMVALGDPTDPARDEKGPAPDKSRFNLFHPTPPDLLRDLSPDRPDKTESPMTVDAGHFQVEMDFATFTGDWSDDVRTEIWNVTPINLKVGLLNNVDVQLIFDNYFHVRENDREAGTTMVRDGFGDLTLRLKVNFWGNDGGRTALAMLPFIKFPTNTNDLGNDSVEGGMIFPFAIELPSDWEIGMETGWGVIRSEERSGYHAEFVNSVTVGHIIAGELRGYVEFFSRVSAERSSSWIGTFDVGLVYALSQNIQIDGGCNFGLTDDAPDVNPFTGITIRF